MAVKWEPLQACIEDGSGGGVQQMDKLQLLQLLPRGLLGRIWPAGRVVMGLRVCKWMHTELVFHVEKVLLVGVDAIPMGVSGCCMRSALIQSLTSFPRGFE